MPNPHWPGLDGLRGVAVLIVILFHCSFSVGQYGYVGVDVFFALSGFLITTLLMRERDDTGQISLGRFYSRRVLRLYPALVVCSLAVLGLAVLAGRIGQLGPAVLAALLYYANWWFYTGHPMVLLDHTWTLSIEEHYYLVWAPIVWLATCVNRRARVVGLAVAAMLVLVLVTPWPDSLEAVRWSYLRGTPIIAGSVLALVLRHPAAQNGWRRVADPLGLAGLALVCAVGVAPWPLPEHWLEGATSVPGYATLAVLAAVVLQPRSLTARLLGWRPLRWTGRRAYGLYLYHFPILSLALHQLTVPASMLVRVGLGVLGTFLVAAVSYRVVEKPFLRLKSRFEPIGPTLGRSRP